MPILHSTLNAALHPRSPLELAVGHGYGSGENFDNFIHMEFRGRNLYRTLLTINIILIKIIHILYSAVFWSWLAESILDISTQCGFFLSSKMRHDVVFGAGPPRHHSSRLWTSWLDGTVVLTHLTTRHCYLAHNETQHQKNIKVICYRRARLYVLQCKVSVLDGPLW